MIYLLRQFNPFLNCNTNMITVFGCYMERNNNNNRKKNTNETTLFTIAPVIKKHAHQTLNENIELNWIVDQENT